jgi:hypothetical protein
MIGAARRIVQRAVSFRVSSVMVNVRMVNARLSYFLPPHFCEFFRVSGRFPRLENPFKYISNLLINQECGVAAGGRAMA